jgi:hypothetical protein
MKQIYETNISDIQLDPEMDSIRQNIDPNDKNMMAFIRAYEKRPENWPLMLEKETMRLLFSPRRYLAAKALCMQQAPFSWLDQEETKRFEAQLSSLKKLAKDYRKFAEFGKAAVEMANAWNIRRDELTDLLQTNPVHLSRCTSYVEHASDLERAFVEKGYIDLPHNFEFLRRLTPKAQEALMAFAEKTKKKLKRSDMERFIDEETMNRTKQEPIAITLGEDEARMFLFAMNDQGYLNLDYDALQQAMESFIKNAIDHVERNEMEAMLDQIEIAKAEKSMREGKGLDRVNLERMIKLLSRLKKTPGNERRIVKRTF